MSKNLSLSLAAAFILFTGFNRQVWALQENAQTKAIVTVLRAPLHSAPNLKSKVLLYRRKGELIYIHPQHFHRDPLNRPEPDTEFYKTMTDTGHDAYIQKPFAFLLTKDARELEPIRLQQDPTDYRLP